LLENLPKATILHLACHGHQDPEDPLKSGFVLRDKMLTIEELMHIPLPHAFMAFLSACETAKGDKAILTMHEISSLKFALIFNRSMEDVDGPIIAKSVYENMFAGDAGHISPDDVAYALDEAVRALRLTQADPSRWAPYIHLG
ncbi:hypothetical protein PUNSTDRAFT_18498, partial [Punctularia strigosozonata HHB-11173 SS5]|uniref:uncharacterized protein n=1 Tax=Punctularia strigosozonata (strain HHB-11173) TaxID=741275 RepID=UPI0004416648